MSSPMFMQGMILAQTPPSSQSGRAADVNTQHPVETQQAVARDEEALGSSNIEHPESVDDVAPKIESDLLPRQFSKTEVLWLLVKSSAVWVLLGVSFMVLGIGIVQAEIFPLIFTCPQGATCPNTFDPNSTNALSILQALMSYWHTIWMTVAGFGVVKLFAYQSWFIMMRDGNTIKDTNLNIGALKGSLLDACLLLFRRGKKYLCILVIAQIGIFNATQIILGLSISRAVGQKLVEFSYPDVSYLPDSSFETLNNDGQVEAIAKVTAWALTNDTSHGPALQGSLVLPDGRSNQSVNARPGGPLISGDIICAGYADYNITTMATGDPQYNINVGGRIYIGTQRTLAVVMTHIYLANTTFLWTSNTTGFIPNATLTSDGGLYIALCNHTIKMVEPSYKDPDVQYIAPNDAVVTGCMTTDVLVCVADSVNDAMVQFWGGVGQAFFGASCRGGILGPLKKDPNNICPLTADLWVATLTSMLDAIMQTSPTTGLAPQRLVANVQNLSTGRWWIQGLLPFCTLVLYGVALCYTLVLSQGHNVLKELNLAEVIAAARADRVRDLPDSERSMIQYKPGVGLVLPNSRLNV